MIHNLPCLVTRTNTVASRNLEILTEREPVKRTQTAYIDMYTRMAAKQASHTTGAIYGLMVNVRLAEETGIGENISANDINVSNEPE
jgi:hypothetical protein